MDVMKPTLIKIGGKCYRKMPFEQSFDPASSDVEQRSQSEGRNTDESVQDYESCEGIGSVEKTDKGYKLCMPVPSVLFRFIIGAKGDTKRKIEKETKTQIMIPKQGQEGDIVITGQQRSAVMAARSRIEVISESSRHKIPFTHFLSFPLCKSDLMNKIDEFKTNVLKDCSECRGVDPSIFQLPSKIHLTIAMLTLLDEKEVRNAADLLSRCYKELVSRCLQNTPVAVELKGVEYMNDDPAEVDVLYAKVFTKDGSNRLQLLAESLVDRFVSEGFMKREYDRVKLHATVMNSKLRDSPEGVTQSKRGRVDGSVKFANRVSFDARKIVTALPNVH